MKESRKSQRHATLRRRMTARLHEGRLFLWKVKPALKPCSNKSHLICSHAKKKKSAGYLLDARLELMSSESRHAEGDKSKCVNLSSEKLTFSPGEPLMPGLHLNLK